MEHEYDGVKGHMDDEIQQKEEVGRQLNKAMGEVNHWRAKYEQEALARIEELEASKVKLQARLAECEATMENQVQDINGLLNQLFQFCLCFTTEWKAYVA